MKLYLIIPLQLKPSLTAIPRTSVMRRRHWYLLVSLVSFPQHKAVKAEILWRTIVGPSTVPVVSQAHRRQSLPEPNGCPIASSTKLSSQSTASICEKWLVLMTFLWIDAGHLGQEHMWSSENRRNWMLGRSCVAWQSGETPSREKHHRMNCTPLSFPFPVMIIRVALLADSVWIPGVI